MNDAMPAKREEIPSHIAARILGFGQRTIRRWCKKGKIKHARRMSAAKKSPWMFDRVEIESLKNH